MATEIGRLTREQLGYRGDSETLSMNVSDVPLNIDVEVDSIGAHSTFPVPDAIRRLRIRAAHLPGTVVNVYSTDAPDAVGYTEWRGHGQFVSADGIEIRLPEGHRHVSVERLRAPEGDGVDRTVLVKTGSRPRTISLEPVECEAQHAGVERDRKYMQSMLDHSRLDGPLSQRKAGWWDHAIGQSARLRETCATGLEWLDELDRAQQRAADLGDAARTQHAENSRLNADLAALREKNDRQAETILAQAQERDKQQARIEDLEGQVNRALRDAEVPGVWRPGRG